MGLLGANIGSFHSASSSSSSSNRLTAFVLTFSSFLSNGGGLSLGRKLSSLLASSNGLFVGFLARTSMPPKRLTAPTGFFLLSLLSDTGDDESGSGALAASFFCSEGLSSAAVLETATSSDSSNREDDGEAAAGV